MDNNRNNTDKNGPTTPSPQENDTTRKGTERTERDTFNKPEQGDNHRRPEDNTTRRTQEEMNQDNFNTPEQDDKNGRNRNDPFKPEDDNTRTSL